MIFKGMPELEDTMHYKMNAMERKKRYCNENGIRFTGVDQLEFVIREDLERVYDKHPGFPYVNVEDAGNATAARQEAKLDTRVRSTKGKIFYSIIYPWGLPVAIGRFIGSVFLVL